MHSYFYDLSKLSDMTIYELEQAASDLGILRGLTRNRDELISAISIYVNGTETFKYEKSLNHKVNNTIKNVKSVTFDVSQNGEVKAIITFGSPTTEKEAIKKAEKFLSAPITTSWLQKLGAAAKYSSLEEAKRGGIENKGDLLGGSINLETAELDKNGNLTLWCGS